MLDNKKGIFTISLDFELFWGVRDVVNLNEYEENLKGVSQAIPLILALFNEFNIHATWAIVGFIFFDNVQALQNNIPLTLPHYTNKRFCPYLYINENSNTLNTQYHFSPQLIKAIQKTPHQEIATHTFSHYYCLEKGQTPKEFADDIIAAKRIAEKFNIRIKSIVFPRNQFNETYLNVVANHGIQTYRGTEKNWLYRSVETTNGLGKIKRILRLLDAYFNLTGSHANCLERSENSLINIPSSRFLRPYHPRLKWLEKIRMQRIKKAMHDAAIKNKAFHLWWHPHNFGKYTQENIDFLTEILHYFKELNRQYGMVSLNMGEIGERLI